MSKPQIPVTPKLYVQSKTTIGIVISVAGIVLSTLGQQPWLDPNVAKMVTTGGLILAGIGQADRKDLFFRPGGVRQAAEDAAANLTLTEVAQTFQQGLKVATAPAEERPGLAVDMLVDFQKRLSNQDAVLAEIRAATTAQQFPPLVGYPDRSDLPASSAIGAVLYPDPRQQAQMAPPPLMGGPGMGEQVPVLGQAWESDVLQASSEGELPLENY